MNDVTLQSSNISHCFLMRNDYQPNLRASQRQRSAFNSICLPHENCPTPRAHSRVCLQDVRFTLESGHWLSVSGCPLSANSGLMHRSKWDRYSITSSARASNVGGTSRPSKRAVCRLIMNSNLVDCKTGRSAGLAPLRMLPA